MGSSDRPDIATLLPEIASPTTLEAAWLHVKRTGAAAGIDRVTVDSFAVDAPQRLASLHQTLIAGLYRPKPARRVSLPDDPERRIAIPVVRDRIVQRAVAMVLVDYFDATLSPAAHAYRPHRSVETALARVEYHLGCGRRWFARTDVAKFFDRIDRARLLDALRTDGVDPRVVRLVGRLLAAGAVEGAAVHDDGVGASQGSALSPLLSNLYLRPVDAALTEAGFAHLRYADDILLLGETEDETTDAMNLLAHEVAGVGLELNARKSRRGHLRDGFAFLGAWFDAEGRSASVKALVALEQRLSQVRRDAAEWCQDASALLAIWRRSYGNVRPGTVRTLGVLAAVALVDDTLDWAAAGPKLAARRCGIESDALPGEVHMRLVDRWLTLESREGDTAALLDARSAAADGRRHEVLARPLGVPSAALDDSVFRSWRALSQCLSAHGATRLARAAAELAGLAPSGTVTRDVPDTEVLVRWLDRLRGREGVHAVERCDARGQYVAAPVRAPLTAESIALHLAGDARRGVYLVRSDGALCLAALVVGIQRSAARPPWSVIEGAGDAPARWRQWLSRARHTATALARAAQKWSMPAIVEEVGGHQYTVWLPFDAPVALRHVHALLVALVEAAGSQPEGVTVTRVPSTDRRPRKGNRHGPWLWLPLGRGPRSGAFGRWVDADTTAMSDPRRVWVDAPSVSAERVHALVRRGHVPMPITRGLDVVPPATFPVQSRAEVVLQHCGVMRALCEKAARLGHLEGIERASLVEVFAHLPADEGAAALRVLWPGGPDVERRVARRLSKVPASPVSCAKLRQRHAGIATEVGCDCRFRSLPRRCYPTPLLHTLRPHQIDDFKARMKRPSQRTTREPEVAEIEQALGRMREARQRADAAEAEIAAAESALDGLFGRLGRDRVQLGVGVLVRTVGERSTFHLEL